MTYRQACINNNKWNMEADPLEQLVSVMFCCFTTLTAPVCDCHYCDGIGGSCGEEQLKIWPIKERTLLEDYTTTVDYFVQKNWTQKNCSNLSVTAQGMNLWNSRHLPG